MEKKKIAISINLDWPLKRYHELYAGIQKYNNEHTHWNLVWDHFPEIHLSRSRTKPYYDGVIGRIKFDAYEEAKRLGIPVVNTWMTSSLAGEIPSVFCDFKEAGRLAAEHLIKRGFRNFAVIDHRVSKAAKSFYEGFSEEVKPYKKFFNKYLFNRNCDDSAENWKRFMDDFSLWVKAWNFPIGIACSSSSIGPKITTRLEEHGISVPNQAAVISAGNDLSYCEGQSPYISSVNVDDVKAGYETARMMHRLLNGEAIDSKIKLISPINVVPRESTDAYAVDDDLVKTALRFIADNYDRNIQVIDVVNNVPISRRSLELRFNKSVGHTIIDEINRHQITSAKRLLLETDSKINQLYEKVGFSCPQHMRRVFRRNTGMTPGEYKRKMKDLSLGVS